MIARAKKRELIIESIKSTGICKIKFCKKCKTTKKIEKFYKTKSTVDGYKNYCKICWKTKNNTQYKKHSESIKLKSNNYRKTNIEKIREYDRKRSKNRPSELSRYYLSMKRSKKKNATPSWLSSFDKSYIKNIYIQAVELKNLNKKEYHVDHIIPLSNDLVCGLHVPWNLQILEARKNASKSNKFDGTKNNETWKKEII